jgi:hypothetical protein
MEEQQFRIIALTPAGPAGPELVMGADRAGCLGIINAEIGPFPGAALEQLAGQTRRPFGVKLVALDARSLAAVEESAPSGLGWLILDAAFVLDQAAATGLQAAQRPLATTRALRDTGRRLRRP